jgi:protein O-mannosyl-transferase
MNHAGARSHRLGVAVLLAVAVAAAMGRSVGNGFVLDDLSIVVRNPHVTDPAQWHLILTSPYWQQTLWRPLSLSGFALQWAIGGGRPWIFHFVSLLGYLAAGVLLAALLRRLGLLAVAATAAAVLWVIHPVHVEVVANVVGQAEIWAALFTLVATVLYLRARERGTLSHWRGIVPVAAAVAAAIVSKEEGFVAIGMLFGLEWLVPADPSRPLGQRLRPLLPILAVTLLLFYARMRVTGTMVGEVPAAAFAGAGIGGRALTFLAVVPRYALLLFWPQHLQAVYGPPAVQVGGPVAPIHLLGLAIVIAVVAGFVVFRRRAPIAAFGLWWGIVALAPVSNLLVPTGIVMAERVFFLASIGALIAVAAGFDALARRAPARRLQAAVAALVVLWSGWAMVRSAMRVGVWHDNRTFFTQLPHNGAHTYLAALIAGVHWETAGSPDLAEANYRQAMALWQHDPAVFIRYGQLLRVHHRCDEAEPILQRGLDVDNTTAIVRAELVECQITLKHWDAAERTAREGIALGHPEFERELQRVQRAQRQAAAGSVAHAGS